jgi:undecaprenyl-phosphate 4-deoxy-4-formamido-L-arabinose transferase
MSKSISYIIAGYNEEENIENAVLECYKYLENFHDFELILVDDASKDKTREIMDRLAKEKENINVLYNYVNLNFGTSVLRGLKFASKEFIIFNAVDLPLSPALTGEIVNCMDDCDLLVLQRDKYIGTAWRRIASIINGFLLRILFPKLIRGTPVLNFSQVFRRNIIDEILPLARSPIFVWPELIFRAKMKKLRVKNKIVPLSLFKPRKGSFGKPHDIIWGMYDMFRFRILSWFNKI